MNGREIEHLLTLIDQNIAQNEQRVQSEIFAYFESHTAEAVRQLREGGRVEVPTSRGKSTFTLQELQAAAA